MTDRAPALREMIEKPVRWTAETLAGAMWPVYLGLGQPAGDVPEQLTVFLWCLTAAATLRGIGLIIFIYLAFKIARIKKEIAR